MTKIVGGQRKTKEENREWYFIRNSQLESQLFRPKNQAMPPYELAVIVKAALSRTDLASVLKKSCQTIWNRNGVIRKIENLGERELPHKMTAHDKSKWNHGHYFIVNLDLSSDSVVDMRNDFIKDKSLIRSSILREEPLFQRPCLKGEECLFGDLPVPDHEKQVYKVKHLKRLARYDNKKRNKNLDSDRYSSLPID